MGVQVVTMRVNVGVEPGSPPGTEETVVHRGAMIPEWVDQYTQFVLTHTGMGRHVEDPDPGLVAMANPPEPVRLPEHPPLTEEQQRARATSRDDVPPRSASKDAWRQHALAVETAKGRDEAGVRAELDPLTRDELVERYGR